MFWSAVWSAFAVEESGRVRICFRMSCPAATRVRASCVREVSDTDGVQQFASRRITLLAVFLLAITLAGTALAGPSDEAEAAYDRGDYATAMRMWQPLANAGSAIAQGSLGVMYAKGQGVQQDYAEAIKWFRKAADQGNANAQFSLGLMYWNGQGVPKDYVEAVKWYRKAADQGYPDAQHNLGVMYADSRGVPQDYAEAIKWWREAADQGYGPAQHALGVMYVNGQGVPKDYVEAHKWFILAASPYQASEAENRGKAVTNRDWVAGKMTPAQIAEAQKRAREWKPK